MNILKVLGVVVGIHLVAYIVIAQPGCRSTAPKPAAANTAAAPAASAAVQPTPVEEAQPDADVSLNLSFAAPGGDRYAPTRPGTEAATIETTPAKTYVVKKGDSFYTIAKKNGVTVDQLTAANNLGKSASIRPGQKLVIPTKGAAAAPSASVAALPTAGRSVAPAAAPVASGATYTVKSGDTLSKIASRNHTTSAALRSLNGISGDHLKIGQVLQLPGNGPAASTPSLPPPPSAQPTSVPSTVAAPAGAGVHTVASGESAESIARKYQISVGELVRANQITDPKKIRIGQVLTIPGAGAARAAKPAPSLVPEAPAATAESFVPMIPVAPTSDRGAAPAAPEAEDVPMVPVDEAPPAVPAN